MASATIDNVNVLNTEQVLICLSPQRYLDGADEQRGCACTLVVDKATGRGLGMVLFGEVHDTGLSWLGIYLDRMNLFSCMSELVSFLTLCATTV